MAAAVCARPGCGKPTFNGMPNEFCSRKCRAGSMPMSGPSASSAAPQAAYAPIAPICARAGCNKPTFNGRPNEFCSRACRARGAGVPSVSTAPNAAPSAAPAAAAALAVPICGRPGCGKPTFDGRPGFCSRRCLSIGAVPAPAPAPPAVSAACARPGCERPSWNGQSGEFCSLTCHSLSASAASAGMDEVPRGWFDINGNEAEFCCCHCGTAQYAPLQQASGPVLRPRD
mmetsp:Transcript_35786/g.44194  ORF Transcript_35786/g.44194 Transcript_35786/m.44194 type:complete len:229 (+) Transcript_35786:83-769(+)